MRLAVLAFVLGACSTAGSSSGAHVTIHDIAPRPQDVSTIDGIVNAFYEIVNVAPGQPRQWDRDHTLYAPWVHFVAHMPERVIMTHQEFVDRFDGVVKTGFIEKEIKRTVTRFGNVAQVASTYETVTGDHHSRGVNLLQLYYDGNRWWIEGSVWQDETSDLPIPKELLP